MAARKLCESEHDFTLVLTSGVELTEEVERSLFEAGCDDATLSTRNGRMYITFSRKAESLKQAMLDAINAVRSAGIGADVLRVDACDLVTQADIGRRIGRTRQAVHQYIVGERGPGSFPPPVCNMTDDSPLWYWCEVAYWLWENDMIHEDVLREAQEVFAINTVLSLEYHKQLTPQLLEEVIGSLALGFSRR